MPSSVVTADRPERLPAAPSTPPRLAAWDSSLALLADPYRFIGRHCQALGSEAFETRLLLQRTICITGVRAAELFYDPRRFRREGAAPEALKATLFGKGSVHGLDGSVHLRRKALFMACAAPPRVDALARHADDAWDAALRNQWPRAAGPFSLYRAVQPVLARAVCAWAGVPLTDADVPRRTRRLTAMFDGSMSGLLRHLQARIARWQAEAWLGGLIEDHRAGRIALPSGAAAHAAAMHRDEGGRLLPARIAAVELLNLLRPTVAVSAYIAFVAHALHLHPHWREALAGPGGDADALHFVQEVRRRYPFIPAMVARVRGDFDWQGILFCAGRRVLLDLYGTDHDPRAWDDPYAFRPERWRGRPFNRFDFVPQGGGDAATRHRCPGEDVATRLMLLALRKLASGMRYDVPAQDLSLAMDRLPAVPRSGLLIGCVKPL